LPVIDPAGIASLNLTLRGATCPAQGDLWVWGGAWPGFYGGREDPKTAGLAGKKRRKCLVYWSEWQDLSPLSFAIETTRDFYLADALCVPLLCTPKRVARPVWAHENIANPTFQP